MNVIVALPLARVQQMSFLRNLFSLGLAKPALLAVVGAGALSMSALAPSSSMSTAPAFVAASFEITCPGSKEGDCRPNHHCPIQWTCWESSGDLKAKGVGTPLYCTDGGGPFVGCGHVFHTITRCVNLQQH